MTRHTTKNAERVGPWWPWSAFLIDWNAGAGLSWPCKFNMCELWWKQMCLHASNRQQEYKWMCRQSPHANVYMQGEYKPKFMVWSGLGKWSAVVFVEYIGGWVGVQVRALVPLGMACELSLERLNRGSLWGRGREGVPGSNCPISKEKLCWIRLRWQMFIGVTMVRASSLVLGFEIKWVDWHCHQAMHYFIHHCQPQVSSVVLQLLPAELV